ncbi:DUF4142 domain-containing protein [Myxococcaceae bacterium JPH2]|nr:DUF4142 domain-containing protein [Myxococcaceae bacterium JPH2]
MKRTTQGVVLAVTLLAGGISLAQGGAASKGKSAGGMTEYRGFSAPTDEKALLDRLHAVNQGEIKAGKLAMQNSQNPDVKSYAEQMVRDHTAMDQKVTTLAQGKGLKLDESPKALDDAEKRSMAADKATTEQLQALKGAPFDSVYMSNQVGAHDLAIGQVLAARHGMSASGELATMLTDLSQKLPQHRDMAYQVLGKLSGAMGVGGSGESKGMKHGDMQHGDMQHGDMQHGDMPSGGTTGSSPSPQP